MVVNGTSVPPNSRAATVVPAVPVHGLPRVVILLSDAGGGHRSAARSLAEALDGQAQVSLLNLLDEYTPFPFNRVSSSYGPWVTHAPGLYSLIYRATESRRPVIIGEWGVYPLVRRRVREALLSGQPDLVISVHPLLTGVPLRVLRENGSPAPFVTVVTDPITAHPAWFCPSVDLCVVATEETRARAIASGIPSDRVKIIGLPVRRMFGVPHLRPKEEYRAGLGLAPQLPLVLLTGGGAGIGKVIPMARAIAHRLAQSQVPVQMAIIAGRNKELLQQLRKSTWPIRVIPLGFVDAMADWLAASDLLISKAGPGTLAEAACLGVPVLVTGYIPGQEEGNIAWIVKGGAGAFAQSQEQVAALVSEWLQPGNTSLQHMAEQARILARPRAAEEIAASALALCKKQAM